MADLSDVEAAFVTAVSSAIYSSAYTPGTLQTSLAECSAKTARGWPVANTLDTALAAGNAYVTVFSQPNSSRDTTRYSPQPVAVSQIPITLQTAISGQNLTFTGTCTAGQVVGITASNVGYAYRMLTGDTPSTVAAAFAASIPGATSASNVLTVPANLQITVARIVSDTTTIAEVGRQTQVFTVTIWAPTPALRDKLASLIQPALAATRTMALADGTQTDILKYRGSFVDDVTSKSNVWKRTLRYETEYPTTLTQTVPAMLFESVNVLFNAGEVVTFGTIQPPSQILMDLATGNLLISDGNTVMTSLDGDTGAISGTFTDQYGNPVTDGLAYLTGA